MDASAFLAAIVESSSDAIVGKTLNGVVRSWNAAAERMFGYRADEIMGCSIRILIPPDRQAEEDCILASVIEGRRVEPFETTRLHKDGNELPVSVTVSPVRDETGKVVAASKIIRDLSPEAERPETWVTDCSGHMGDTSSLASQAGGVECPGRSVRLWKSVFGSSRVCSMGRR